MTTRMSLVLGAPGEAEVPLLAELGAREDIQLLAVIDPSGECLGASIAEIMGLPVLSSLDQLTMPNGDRPSFVLPAGPAALAAALAREAEDRGLTVTRAEDLRAQLAAVEAPPATTAKADASPDLEAIDRESRELQASLADLEDALAGDTIMRRLLALCTRAVGASGGSIMLFDEASRELYIAYATGLSEGTMHATRMKLGEGISGRVARSRQAELVEGQKGTEDRHRDRPNIASAICMPLHHDDRLLGVLNVSTQAGEPPLTTRSRDVLAGLAERLSRILDEVMQWQRQRTGRMFHVTEQQLRRVAADVPALPEMLEAWSAAIALTAEADHVSIVVPCADGNLLVAEAADESSRQHWYESLHNPAWIEVLGSGAPLVARQETTAIDTSDATTVFYLPIGRGPVRAGLAVAFAGASRAHAFHAIAGETVFLLERLLPDLLAQRQQAHRADMLSRLSQTMSGLTVQDGTPGALLQKLSDALRELTGARFAAVIAELRDPLPRLGAGNAPEDSVWLRDAGRFLEAAVADGWRITTLETPDSPLSVMTLTSPTGDPTPGVVLVGKERTHELDGSVFTPLDAELALPLVSMLPRLMPRSASGPPPEAAPTAEKPTSAAPSMFDHGPIGDTIGIQPVASILPTVDGDAAGEGARDDDPSAELERDLTREMDRCDRYHNVCGVIICRPEMDIEAAADLLEVVAAKLRERMRISDRVYALPTGELVLLVPEDVRHLEQIQDRVCDDIRRKSGDPELMIFGGRAAYPTVRGPADVFLATIRKRLRP